jgi:hypothetical protein
MTLNWIRVWIHCLWHNMMRLDFSHRMCHWEYYKMRKTKMFGYYLKKGIKRYDFCSCGYLEPSAEKLNKETGWH